MSNRSDVLARVIGSNPIPTVDDVTQGDLADLRTLVEQRRLDMSTPVKHTAHTPMPPDGGRRWLRPVVAFAAAAVIVLLTLGVGSVLLGGGDAAEPADEITTSTTVGTTVTTQAAPNSTTTTRPQEDVPDGLVLPPGPSFDATLLAEGWTMTHQVENGEVAGVVTTEAGSFVAAGFGPKVLFSLDGSSWEDANSRAIRDEAGFLTDVVVVGGDTVLVGHTCEGGGDFGYEPFPCPLEMRLWTGDPEVGNWETVDFGGFTCVSDAGECYATVDKSAASLDGMFLTGTKSVGSEGGGYTSERAIWTSSDGVATWNKYAFPTMEDLGLDEWVVLRDDPDWSVGTRVLDAVRFNDEWVMVVLADAWNWTDDTGRGESLVLSSQDGSSWTQIVIEDFDPELGDNIVALVAGPDQLVALGRTGDVQRQAAWVTADTSVWERAEIESNSVGEFLTATYDDQIGFVTSGDFLDGEQAGYDFWVSSNGAVWSPAGLTIDDGFWVRSMTSSGGVIVSTGITNFDMPAASVMGLFLWTSD